MPLYHWKSKTFADYANGDIIVSAGSVDKAKAKVRKHIKEEYKNNLDYMARTIQGVEFDMSVKPNIIATDVAIVFGSA